MLIKYLLFLFLFLILSTSVWADTHTAASCSYANVLSAYNDASNGDTVQIPNGSCDWAGNQLTITKAITLKGNGIYGATYDTTGPEPYDAPTDTGTWPLVINVTAAHNYDSSIMLNVTSGSLVRITGISFTGSAAGSGYEEVGLISVLNTNTTPWRLDNLRSGILYRFINTNRSDQGLIDHVFVMRGCTTDGEISINDSRNSSEGHWATGQTLTWGSSGFVFIEDSTFVNVGCTSPGPSRTFFDTNTAGRAVVRYNYIYDGQMVWHGFGSGHGSRSGNAFEVYNNTFYWSVIGDKPSGLFGWRGGTALIYNNAIYNEQTIAHVRVERVDTCTFYGCCDNANAWDGDSADPDGYPCCDQVGRGAAAGTTLETAQPQELKPGRIWNNTLSGVSGTILNSHPTYIVANRDYYYCTDSSCAESYTPYTYPHPLQGGTPSSVQGLIIQGGTLK